MISKTLLSDVDIYSHSRLEANEANCLTEAQNLFGATWQEIGELQVPQKDTGWTSSCQFDLLIFDLLATLTFELATPKLNRL